MWDETGGIAEVAWGGVRGSRRKRECESACFSGLRRRDKIFFCESPKKVLVDGWARGARCRVRDAGCGIFGSRIPDHESRIPQLLPIGVLRFVSREADPLVKRMRL